SLVGPGGVGKTRLALAVAAELIDRYADHVVFVDLAPLRNARLVAATIAGGLGVHDAGGRSARELLLEYLAERQVLLLLDNFEHLLEAAPLLAELLGACPRLALLVTSRAALRLRGEHRVAVPPLATPEDPAAALATIAAAPAVQLFVDRTRAVAPDFELEASTAPAVAGICRRLDGLPLAIELAAARTGLLGPEALLRRLEQRLGPLALLMAGAPDLPERQQTLRATLAWSQDLLGPAEQVLFRRLAVFAGGWTLDAAEAVCGGPDLPAEAVLDRLQVLVDASLIQVRERDHTLGEPRFGLLETVREFAAEQLETCGEAEAVRARHFDWCLGFAEARQAELRGPRQQLARSRLDLEADNMRAALDWSLARLKSPTGALHGRAALRLGGALARWWSLRGSSSEGSRWLEQLLAAVDANRPADGAADASTIRARVLLGLGWLYSDQGQFGRAQRRHEASLSLFRAGHDQGGMAAALLYLAHLADYHGDVNRALDLFTASAEQARAAGDRSRLGEALGWLGWARYRRGELDAARAALRLGGALARWWSLRGSSSEGSRWLEQLLAAVDANPPAGGAADASTIRARVLLGLGWLYSDQGQFGQAQRCHEASLPLFRAGHDQHGLAAALLYLAHLADYHGETNRALDLFTASAEHARAAGDRSRLGEALGWLGWARYRRGELDAARVALLEGRTLLEASGDNARLADVLYALGILEAEQNDAVAAERVLRQSFELFQRAGDHVGETKALGWLGYVALNRGDQGGAGPGVRMVAPALLSGLLAGSPATEPPVRPAGLLGGGCPCGDAAGAGALAVGGLGRGRACRHHERGAGVGRPGPQIGGPCAARGAAQGGGPCPPVRIGRPGSDALEPWMTSGSWALRSSRLRAWRTAAGVRTSPGAEYTRRPGTPHVGQGEGLLASPNGRRSSNGPHRSHWKPYNGMRLPLPPQAVSRRPLMTR
ncbi:MAG: AAA family ATPase, partial [Chloroflexi bacterium]|nr:AAA family ATPase [Chloroflexota bacterium]